MGGGYVLGFSDRTFGEFFLDDFGIDIWEDKYSYATGSKANRMRAFWRLESDYLVGQVLGAIFDDWEEFGGLDADNALVEECRKVVQRLRESAPPPDLAMIVPIGGDASLDTLARSVRESIERNEPEAGLDRLHTFVVKYFRTLCERRGIETPRSKPLHSLVGEYVKAVQSAGEIESEMTVRILKSSISVMDSFNSVRNDRSLAHDNEMLSRDEAMLIVSYVTSLVRFVQAIEARSAAASSSAPEFDDIPF